MKLGNSPGRVNSRRLGALNRLNVNLLKNQNALKALDLENPENVQQQVNIERDSVRILNEIAILKTRITSPENALMYKNKKYKATR